MGKTTKLIQDFLPVVITVIYLIVAIVMQKETFALTYPVATYEKMYGESQYVLGNASQNSMGDGDIYTYAGIRYIRGEDPTKINFEHPPLAKYLYGLSYQLFGLPNIILIPLFLIAVYSFWQLTTYVLKSQWSRYLALFLFLGHSTVYKELARTMLDLPMTTALLATTLLFCRFIDKPNIRRSILFGVSGGLLLAVKYPIPLTLLYLGLMILFAVSKKIKITRLVVSLIIMNLTYLGTYTMFFIKGQPLIDFLKFEWWRWHWFQGKTDNPRYLLLQVIFLGKYPKWWDSQGGFVFFPHWSLLWPISLILYCLSWFKQQKPILNSLFPYKLWILSGFIILLLGAYEDRFLLPLIPGFAIFGTALIEKLYSEIIRK